MGFWEQWGSLALLSSTALGALSASIACSDDNGASDSGGALNEREGGRGASAAIAGNAHSGGTAGNTHSGGTAGNTHSGGTAGNAPGGTAGSSAEGGAGDHSGGDEGSVRDGGSDAHADASTDTRTDGSSATMGDGSSDGSDGGTFTLTIIAGNCAGLFGHVQIATSVDDFQFTQEQFTAPSNATTRFELSLGSSFIVDCDSPGNTYDVEIPFGITPGDGTPADDIFFGNPPDGYPTPFLRIRAYVVHESQTVRAGWVSRCSFDPSLC